MRSKRISKGPGSAGGRREGESRKAISGGKSGSPGRRYRPVQAGKRGKELIR